MDILVELLINKRVCFLGNLLKVVDIFKKKKSLMINFYGRKTPRKVNKYELVSLFDDDFFHHKNIKNFNKLILKDSVLNLEIGFWVRRKYF